VKSFLKEELSFYFDAHDFKKKFPRPFRIVLKNNPTMVVEKKKYILS
jgi:hypothetical protein